MITTYKYAATEIKILEEQYYGELSCRTEHRMTKCLNNLIEQDHRFIKKKTKSILDFQSYEIAMNTICGIEAIYMNRKGQVEEVQCVLSEIDFINNIMEIGA